MSSVVVLALLRITVSFQKCVLHVIFKFLFNMVFYQIFAFYFSTRIRHRIPGDSKHYIRAMDTRIIQSRITRFPEFVNGPSGGGLYQKLQIFILQFNDILQRTQRASVLIHKKKNMANKTKQKTKMCTQNTTLKTKENRINLTE